jgi:UDP-N-acetylglucosamine--N-acetylmuramyl-(pentapeptide) pyrophosphoryl-undecaprenol N-acetylglucosamine transferase
MYTGMSDSEEPPGQVRVPEASQKLSHLVASGMKVLWVASTGGHFEQLRRISLSSNANEESMWVTFESPQTSSALIGTRHRYVPYIAPRDLKNTVRAAGIVKRILDQESFDICISTGAALAAAVLPQARLRGIKTNYIESISRVEGPSLTGRMLNYFPGIKTYTQHSRWESQRWHYQGSVLDSWSAERRTSPPPKRIFVTLGTIRPYRFDRAVDAVLSILQHGQDVVWQLGATERSGLPGDVHLQMDATQFREQINLADSVVTHSGVGTIMQILDQGKMPVLAVRSKNYSEHVDDHQHEIAAELTRRGLALDLNLENPSAVVLTTASSHSVRTGKPPE